MRRRGLIRRSGRAVGYSGAGAAQAYGQLAQADAARADAARQAAAAGAASQAAGRTPTTLPSGAIATHPSGQMVYEGGPNPDKVYSDDGTVWSCPLDVGVFSRQARVKLFHKRVNKWVLWVHTPPGSDSEQIAKESVRQAFEYWFRWMVGPTFTNFQITNIAYDKITRQDESGYYQARQIPASMLPPEPSITERAVNEDGSVSTVVNQLRLSPNQAGNYRRRTWVHVPGYQTVRDIYAEPSLKKGDYAMVMIEFEYWGKQQTLPWPVFRDNVFSLPSSADHHCPVGADVVLAYAIGNQYTLANATSAPQTATESLGDAAVAAEKYLAKVGTTVALIAGAYVVVKIAGRL